MNTQMTNQERIETLAKLREQVVKAMNYCTQQIDAPLLLKCNCIVATVDAEYQVTVNDETHKAEVLHGNYSNPCHFTERLASKIACEIHASNGHGPLRFIVWGWKNFYKARLSNLQVHLDMYEQLIEQFSN